MQDDVLFESKNGWGVMTLNRPSALNALTIDMVKALRTQLVIWSGDKSVSPGARCERDGKPAHVIIIAAPRVAVDQ